MDGVGHQRDRVAEVAAEELDQPQANADGDRQERSATALAVEFGDGHAEGFLVVIR